MPDPPLPPLSDDDTFYLLVETLPALPRVHSDQAAALPLRVSSPLPPWLVVLSLLWTAVVMTNLVSYRMSTLPGLATTANQDLTAVVLSPSLQREVCLRDLAWSPDGRQVAVLGYRNSCPSESADNYSYQAGVVNIYSTATGHLVREILPDPAVLALPGISSLGTVRPVSASADTSKRAIGYHNVLWSPDGKRLALTFVIFLQGPDGVPLSRSFIGLALINADGTNEHATMFSDTTQYHSALRWDTTTQDHHALPTQPPAMNYTWSASGLLVPGNSPAATVSTATPIGNPDGGSSFTIWQPGRIQLHNFSPYPGAYTWLTSALAWSPDGRFLIESFYLYGLLYPTGEPSPPVSELKAMNLASAPSVGIRDPALQHLLTSLDTADWFDDIAWSPNGHVLAASPYGPAATASGGSSVEPVTLYDCVTGRTLGRLQPPPEANVPGQPGGGLGSQLLWSSDGSHLLLYSVVLGTITIWGPHRLPKSSQER
jgi:WD40 repeat protein